MLSPQPSKLSPLAFTNLSLYERSGVVEAAVTVLSTPRPLILPIQVTLSLDSFIMPIKLQYSFQMLFL